ncbi:MAG: hypothetical protein DRJ98_08635 [Thermoprotei archaeon]|nr:MAG: hypothetical protein DRJ98_08635 [Thermoprotei archaeon]
MLSLGIKILWPRKLVLALLSLIMAHTLAALFSAVSSAYWAVINAALGGSGGVIVMQAGARTVFTSHVPISVYEGLKRHPDVVACEPFTLTPACIGGKAVVVRGATIEYLNSWSRRVASGHIPRCGGLWAVVGARAADRLGLRTGDHIVIASSRTDALMPVEVKAICAFGDSKDYEVLAPLDVGQRIAGLPDTIVSIVEVKGMEKSKLMELLASDFELTIDCNIDVEGWILVFDPLNMLVASAFINNSSALRFSLPFGYYEIYYQGHNVFSKLVDVLLDSDKTVSVNLSLMTNNTLRVVASENDVVLLRDENGTLIRGTWQDGCWAFVVKPGLYTLQVNNNTYQIPVLGDAVFNPMGFDDVGYEVLVTVVASDGTAIEDFIIVVDDENGNTIFTSRAVSSQIPLRLPEGLYTFRIYRPPYFVFKHVDVRGPTNIVIELPQLVKNPEKIPYRFYPKLMSLRSEEAAEYTLYAFAGLTSSYIVAAIALILTLSVLLCLAVQRHIYLSISEDLRVLHIMGFTKSRLLLSIGISHMMLSILSALAGFATAWAIYSILRLDVLIVMLGYGSPFRAVESSIFTLFSATTSWLVSFAEELKRAGGAIER